MVEVKSSSGALKEISVAQSKTLRLRNARELSLCKAIPSNPFHLFFVVKFGFKSKIPSSGRFPLRSSALDGASVRGERVDAPIRDDTGRGCGSGAVEAGGRWGRGPGARLRRRRRHDGVRCGISAALAPARSVGDGGAGVLGVGRVVARDRRCARGCGGRWSGGRGRSGKPLPRGGEVIDAALVVEAGVRGEVRLDIRVTVGGALDLVAGLVDGAGHEAGLVVAEILLDGGPVEVVVFGVVAGARESGAGEVASENLFLEAVEGIRDALKVLEIGHCAGNGRVLSARGKDGTACGCPISGRYVGSRSSVSFGDMCEGWFDVPYGLGDLKASPMTWSSKMWSTFQGLGPLIWLLSLGGGIGVTSGEVLVKAVKEADASPAPVYTWYLWGFRSQIFPFLDQLKLCDKSEEE